MRSSRSLVVIAAVLAVLCMSAVSKAEVITLQATQYGSHGAYAVYTANSLASTLGKGKQLYLKYDLSSIQASIDAGNVVIGAKLIYMRKSDTSFLIQGAAEVVQATVDPTTDTSKSSSDPTHAALINNSTEVMQGINLTFTNEVVTDLGWEGEFMAGGYGGLQSVDVLAIINSWLGGAANYGLGIDTVVAGYTTGLAQHHLGNYVYTNTMPYLEITMTPEPMTMGLLAVGGIAALLRRRRMA
jgi:opacity protein-like surface antigen